MAGELDQIVDDSFFELIFSMLVRFVALFTCVFLGFALLETSVALLLSVTLWFLQISINSIIIFQHNTLMRNMRNQMTESLALMISTSRLHGHEPYEHIEGLDPYEAAEKIKHGSHSIVSPQLNFRKKQDKSLFFPSLLIEVLMLFMGAVAGSYFSDGMTALLVWVLDVGVWT